MNKPDHIDFFIYRPSKPVKGIIGGIIIATLSLIFINAVSQQDPWAIFGAVCISALLGPIGMLLISLDAKKARLRNEGFSEWVRKTHNLHTENLGTRHLGKRTYKSMGMRENVPVEVFRVIRDVQDEKTGKVEQAYCLTVVKL